MSPTETPPGWHPDPADPAASMRWWDGTRWTSDVRPLAGPPPSPYAGSPGPYGGSAAGPYGGPPGPANRPFGSSGGTPPGWYGPTGPPQWSGTEASFARRNQRSLTATGVAILYIIVAITSHLVFFGILPLLFSVRAWQARETLAPLAIAASVVAILVSVIALTAR
jgi:hypothetical protein